MAEECLHKAAEKLFYAKNRTVLLVEDTAAHAVVIRRALENEGWHTEHVTRASTALDSFQSDPNRIVLLDLSLPDCDGLQLLTRLRSFNPQAPIIVVTATDKVTVSVDSMKKGAVDYVVKSDPKDTAKKLLLTITRAWEGRIKEAENDLLEQSRLLESSRTERLETIELIVRTVCHEVNNPLSGVIALSQLLRQNDCLNEDAQKLLSGIENSAQEVKQAVDKLKTIALSAI